MSALVSAVVFFLAVSLLFYALFGGADFGAGILEITSKRKEERDLISRAMAPVWEANHVWLILAVVILFMGFPEVYALASTSLHLPLMAVLAGIVARGCAFTFRYYDPPGGRGHLAYTRVFALSSLWTAFFLGVTAGGLTLGRIRADAAGFGEAYVQPWLNAFSLSLGAFACALFAFLAAVYLVGEAEPGGGLRDSFVRKARRSSWVALVTGAVVFACAELDGYPLLRAFFANALTMGCFVLATLLWFPFRLELRRPGRALLLRGLAGAIVALVMLGWFALRFPVAVQVGVAAEPSGVSFGTAAAPEATLRALLAALVVGVLLIFPALGYLLRVFKWETVNRERLP